MRKQLMMGVAMAALIIGANQAMAQSPGGGPSDRGQSNASEKATGGMERAQQGGMNRSEEGVENSHKAQQPKERSDKNAQMPSSQPSKMGAERGDQSKQNAQRESDDSKMGTKDQKNVQRDSDRKSDKDMKAQGTSDKDMNRNAQNPSSTTTKMGSETKTGTDSRMGAGERSNEERNRVTTGSAASSSVNLTNEQRTEVREKVLAHGPRVDHVDFSLNVGVAIPRTVHVVAVPETLIRIYPEWRHHRYFVVNDQIIIVDDQFRIIAIVNV